MNRTRWSLVVVFACVLAIATVVLFSFDDTRNLADTGGSESATTAPQSQTKPKASERPREQLEQGETASITGQMTLADIQRSTGVPAAEIAKKLNLPLDVSKDETLGRLRQSCPFTMDEVREAVAELAPGRAATGASAGIKPAVSHDEEPQLTRGRGAEDQSGTLITGQMTLREIESRTGVSARAVAQKLGLTPRAPLDMPLGKLRRIYRFTMQDVRAIVADLMKDSRIPPIPPQSSSY